MRETKIFISYAHKDDAYFRVFREGIESHSKSSNKLKWTIWNDKEITIGSLWHEAIQEEIKNCDVAILLVSANFLSSDYIENEEFLHFLKRNEEEGFIFLPVLLSDCEFTHWENLSTRQFFYPQGIDYGIPRLKNISYSHLVEFNRDFVSLPNPYRETYHKKCVEAFEKAILAKQHSRGDLIKKMNDSSLISVLSNKDILNALNLFQAQTRERELNEAELADALDTKIKLYNVIFGKFDNQLDTTYKENLANVVFDRIVFASEQIQKPDIDTIQKFRNNKGYKVRDRSLVVSGLTISLLNNFDAKKMHLLIDFLTDFEEEVWQKALVGLLFSLTLYDNRLSMFPEIGKRLNELKEISDVQKAIYLMDSVLRVGTFSIKEIYKRNPSTVFRSLKILMGNTLEFSKDDLAEIQEELGKLSDTSLEYKILSAVYKKETLEKFAAKFEEVETITMPTEEFYELIGFEAYIGLYELNPLHFDLTDELFQSSRNWFIPFEDNEDIRNILAKNFPVNDIDILHFIAMVEQSSISGIDKHYILSHIKDFSDDYIQMIYFAMIINVANSRSISNLEMIIMTTIRDLHRFNKLFVNSGNNDIFNGELSMYGQSLLDKIANNITEVKVNSQHMFDKERYEESLQFLHTIPKNEYDFDVLRLFTNNYIYLIEYKKAIPYLDELLKFFEDGKIAIPDTDKVYWYQRAKRLYGKLEEEEPDTYRAAVRFYLGKEIAIREKIFKASVEGEFDLFSNDDCIELAETYFEKAINLHNYDANVVEGFFYSIKYLNVFFQIYNTHDADEFLNKIKIRQKSIAIISQMISEDKNVDTIQLLNLKSGENHKLLNTKLKELFEVFEEFKNTASFVEDAKQDEDVQQHAKYLYNTVLPVLKNVNEEQPGKYERIVIAFTIDDEEFKVVFPLNSMLEKGSVVMLEELASHVHEIMKNALYKHYVELFLNYLFSDEKLPPLSKEVILESFIIDFVKIELPAANDTSETPTDTSET